MAAVTTGGLTALHSASQHGHAGVVRVLLDAGADVAAVINDGFSVLHSAAKGGHEVTKPGRVGTRKRLR